MAINKSYIGSTPNGGVRSTIYYRDDDGNPADEGVATAAEIVEFDANGNGIHRTYAARDPLLSSKQKLDKREIAGSKEFNI